MYAMGPCTSRRTPRVEDESAVSGLSCVTTHLLLGAAHCGALRPRAAAPHATSRDFAYQGAAASIERGEMSMRHAWGLLTALVAASCVFGVLVQVDKAAVAA